jgi:light-regulated signal transduction histidine kinase (bacteriophytochrome)
VVKNAEFTLSRKDTGESWIGSYSFAPIRDLHGEMMGTVVTARDITEKRHAEDEIKKLNEELEERVKQRTTLLEAANRELEAFSYSVSHDLRAPLRHINGFADLLVRNFEKDLPEKAKHYLRTITASGQKMGTLIDDLLQFSRTTRTEMRKAVIDMNLLVNEVVSQMQPLIENRKVEFKIMDLPQLCGDYNLLRIVWNNLIDNALKYSRASHPSIISIGYQEEKSEHVFFVRDNGVGFDMKYAKKLFGVFQRLHSEAEFEGTGIGLANVQRIITRHGGRAWAEAEMGKGATFYFSIPKPQELCN